LAGAGVERAQVQHQRTITHGQLLQALQQGHIADLEGIDDHAQARRVGEHVSLFQQQRARHAHEGAVTAHQSCDGAVGNAREYASQQRRVGIAAGALAIEHQFVGEQFFVAIESPGRVARQSREQKLYSSS
jgi:hypothetical protein